MAINKHYQMKPGEVIMFINSLRNFLGLAPIKNTQKEVNSTSNIHCIPFSNGKEAIGDGCYWTFISNK